MSEKRTLSAKEQALLGALAAGEDGARTPEERALLDDAAVRAELDEDRRLVAALRALPDDSPSPSWGALEASLRQACAREAAPRRRWLARWRWPALGLGLASAVALALLLVRPRGQAPALALQPPADAGAAHAADGMADAAPSDEAVLAALAAAAAPSWADDELDDGLDDGLGERGDELDSDAIAALPAAAAITLGLSEHSELGDLDDAEPAGASADDELGAWPGPLTGELDELDSASLERIEAWLARAEKKG